MPDFRTLADYQKVMYVGYTVTFVFQIIGIVDNLILVGIFSRRSLRKYSYSLYSQAKAISDILFILINIRNWIKVVLDIDLQLTNQFLCVITAYGDFLFISISHLLLLFMSIDRLVTVVYPNRFQFIKKRWFQCLLILVAIVYSVCINIAIPIFTSILEIPLVPTLSLKFCYTPVDVFIRQAWIILANITGIVLTANSIINLKLFSYIKSSRNKVASHGDNSHQRSQKNDRKLAVTSIGQGLVAFIIKAIGGVLYVIILQANISLEITYMIGTFLNMIFVIDCGASFFINMIVNGIFREELFHVTGYRCKNSTVDVITNTNMKLKSNIIT